MFVMVFGSRAADTQTNPINKRYISAIDKRIRDWLSVHALLYKFTLGKLLLDYGANNRAFSRRSKILPLHV